ncbi:MULTISPECIES: hypothetical protein [unclassified Frankia]
MSLVPGVRQVQVRDGLGGLDLNQSVFGTLSFLDGVFSTERDITNPFYLTVLVAETPAAIWAGPGGVREAVLAAIEDVRPMGIFPSVERGDAVSVSLSADILVRDVPLPSGGTQVVNASPAAQELKCRLSEQVRGYVMGLSFGEPVRAAEVSYALMSVPGVQDVRDLALLCWPGDLDDAGVPGAGARSGWAPARTSWWGRPASRPTWNSSTSCGSRPDDPARPDDGRGPGRPAVGVLRQPRRPPHGGAVGRCRARVLPAGRHRHRPADLGPRAAGAAHPGA